MKRPTAAWFAAGLSAVAITGLVGAPPRAATGAVQRAAVAFDMSPPLTAMDQFIPDKAVVIHPAVESQPERQGSTEGPGTGLGNTPPSPPPQRAGAAGRAGRGQSATPRAFRTEGSCNFPGDVSAEYFQLV